MTKVAEIVDIVESFAPRSWAESWDNCGLQLGEEGMEVRGMMVALEVTEDVIHEAESIGANLIITHHPLIFKPLSAIRTDQAIGRVIRELLLKKIAVYSAHTNFDRSPDGMNAYLGQLLNMDDSKVLERAQPSLLKLVLFVPVGYEEKVREALTKAGAGHIGRYSDCTYMSTGHGTFRPGDDTHPFIGTPGELQKVNEVKLETVFPSVLRSKIMNAVFAVHPYEEPAYDLYPLSAPTGLEGLGRVGKLKSPIAWEDFIVRIKEIFGKTMLPVGGATPPRTIKKVAVTAGAGSNLMETAAYQKVDVYLTGDIKHHDYRRGEELSLTLVDIGHYASESVGLVHLAELLKEGMVGRGIGLNLSICQTIRESYSLV